MSHKFPWLSNFSITNICNPLIESLKQESQVKDGWSIRDGEKHVSYAYDIMFGSINQSMNDLTIELD